MLGLDIIPNTPLPDLGWDVLYEANVLPDAATPVWTKSAATPDTAEIVGGKFHLGHSTYVGYERAPTIANNATMEVEFKLISGTMAFDLGNDAAYYYVEITSSQVEVFGNTTSDTYSITTDDDYHTYRLSIVSNVAKLYIDRTLRITFDDSGAGFGGYCSFYTKSGSGGEGYFDYVYYSTGGAFVP